MDSVAYLLPKCFTMYNAPLWIFFFFFLKVQGSIFGLIFIFIFVKKPDVGNPLYLKGHFIIRSLLVCPNKPMKKKVNEI